MNAVIAQAFPVLVAHSAGLPFAIFAVAMAVQLIVVWRYFPETKQVALDDLGRRMEAA